MINAVQTRMFANEFPSRPKYFTSSIAKRVAELLLPEVRRWLGDEAGDDDEIVTDLVDAINYGLDDGYEIAKRLECRGYRPDADLCDILDSVGSGHWNSRRDSGLRKSQGGIIMRDFEFEVPSCPGCLKPLLGKPVVSMMLPKMRKRTNRKRWPQAMKIPRRTYCGRTCREADRRCLRRRNARSGS